MQAEPANFALEFDDLALTGRSQAHVRELPEPRCLLHPQAAVALLAMRSAAAAADLDLMPVSGFRDFARQLAIWNAKFRGERPLLDRHGQPVERAGLNEVAIVGHILCWSALPGASRHHWGTEIDVVDGRQLQAQQRPDLLPADYQAGGRFAPLNAWLDTHAHRFGFYRPYDRDRGGVQPEPWHLSFAPIAQLALARLTLSVLSAALSGAALEGRATVLARLPQIYEQYVVAVATPPPQALAAQSRSQAFLK
jgi:LAS superfamily LD-carboxypeptidase LdcB